MIVGSRLDRAAPETTIGFFDRWWGRGTPTWAAPLTPPAYAQFVEALHAALAERHLELDPDTGTARDGDATYGFSDLARKFAQQPDSLHALIADHVQKMLDVRVLSAFEDAAPVLKLKLFPAESVPEFAAGVNGEVFAPGLLAVLCCDLPTHVESVPRDRVRRWERPYAELRALALENLRQHEPVERATLEHAIEETVGEGYCVCGTSLLPDDPPPGELGLLLAVPTRHHVFRHTIRDRSVWSAMSRMATLSAELFQENPGAVSPHLFWGHGGTRHLVHVGIGPDRVSVVPPPDMVALLGSHVPSSPGDAQPS